MAIRLVKKDHMPEAETREAMIMLDATGETVQAHYHKCAEKGDIHVCVHDTHPAVPIRPTHDDDEDDEDADEGSKVKDAQPAPTSLTYENLIGKPLRLVINDGRDSEYKGHFGEDGLLVPRLLS